jgi:hypothetical protein
VRSWRNWQTHQLEGLAVAIPWWFESTRPHQISEGKFNVSNSAVHREVRVPLPLMIADLADLFLL